MHTVSDAFKNAVTAYGRQTKAVIKIGSTGFTGSSVVSVRYGYKGGLLRSVMRECDIELEAVSETLPGAELTVEDDGNGNITIYGDAVTVTDDGEGNVVLTIDGGTVTEDGYDVSIDTPSSVKLEKGTEIDSVSVGVKTEDETEYSMLDLGGFVVDEIEWDKANNSVVLKCYDEILFSMVPYDLELTFPMTLGEYLAAVCDRFGWTLETPTFVNSDVVVEEEKYDATYTFRSVLDEIAQAAAGTISIKGKVLSVLYPTDCGETYTADNMTASDGITIGELYGPVNSVVIARTPQEDNIYRIAEDVAFEEAVEIKIENNQIMDSHREDFIDAIFEQLNGLSFYLYDFHSFGYLYVDLCDVFTLLDQSGNAYSCLMLNDEFTVGQGIDETSFCDAPDATETDYNAASTSDRVLNQTILRVDKQEQEITGLVKNMEVAQNGIDVLQGSMTEVKQTADALTITVTKIEQDGAEKVKTSVNAYTFDDEGLKISKDDEPITNRIDNTGMYVKNNDEVVLSANNEGVNAVDITVRNYLVVGEHSRFEDFISTDGEERTGCFWLA